MRNVTTGACTAAGTRHAASTVGAQRSVARTRETLQPRVPGQRRRRPPLVSRVRRHAAHADGAQHGGQRAPQRALRASASLCSSCSAVAAGPAGLHAARRPAHSSRADVARRQAASRASSVAALAVAALQLEALRTPAPCGARTRCTNARRLRRPSQLTAHARGQLESTARGEGHNNVRRRHAERAPLCTPDPFVDFFCKSSRPPQQRLQQAARQGEAKQLARRWTRRLLRQARRLRLLTKRSCRLTRSASGSCSRADGEGCAI
jgi:hypothetical protein